MLESTLRREVSQTGFSLPGSGNCLLGSLVFQAQKISGPAGGSSELWRAGRRKGKSEVLEARLPGSLAGSWGSRDCWLAHPNSLSAASSMGSFLNVKL